MYVAMYMYDCGYQWISGTHPVFVGTCKLQWRFVRRSKKPAGPLQRSTDLISSSSPATCFQGPSIHGIAAERKKERKVHTQPSSRTSSQPVCSQCCELAK